MLRMRSVCLGVAAAVLLASPAGAQSARGDVALGYSFLRVGSSGSARNIPVGWNLTIGRPVGAVSIVGDLGGHYRGSHDGWNRVVLHTFQGGVRIATSQKARVAPFGQVLTGWALESGGGHAGFLFAIQPGIGVDVVTGQRGLRVRWQVDYSFSFFDGLRTAIGVVLPMR